MGKGGRNRLASKLVSVFKGSDIHNINKAVEEAKDRLNKEDQRKRWGKHEELFNSYLAIAKERGCPDQILEALLGKKEKVLHRAVGMSIKDDNIPFLPVIKSSYLGYSGLMAMVRNGEKQGFVHLHDKNLAGITNLFTQPNDAFCYFIFDIDKGRDTMGRSPHDFCLASEWKSRMPLTIAEVINLCIFTDALAWLNMWAVGSRYESDFGIPGVSLTGEETGRPSLVWNGISFADGNWGTPSCGGR